MKAIAYQTASPISAADSLQDITLPDPVATGRELQVEVKAISVNPVDTKVRAGANPPAGEWKVLGWDAAGVVRAVGPEVTLFKPGDRVWYAGDISRPGSNAELQLVDERIVGHMPKSIDFAQAAALPLTSITRCRCFKLSTTPSTSASLASITGARAVFWLQPATSAFSDSG